MKYTKFLNFNIEKFLASYEFTFMRVRNWIEYDTEKGLGVKVDLIITNVYDNAFSDDKFEKITVKVKDKSISDFDDFTNSDVVKLHISDYSIWTDSKGFISVSLVGNVKKK